MFNDILFPEDVKIVSKVMKGEVFHHFLKGVSFSKGDIVRLVNLNEKGEGKKFLKVQIKGTLTLKVDAKCKSIYIEEMKTYADVPGMSRFVKYGIFSEVELWDYFGYDEIYEGQIIIWGNITKMN